MSEYLDKHKAEMTQIKTSYSLRYDIRSITPERNGELLAAIARQDAYITGGHAAQLKGQDLTLRMQKAGQ